MLFIDDFVCSTDIIREGMMSSKIADDIYDYGSFLTALNYFLDTLLFDFQN